MQDYLDAIAEHFAQRHGENAVYHRAMARHYIKRAHAIRPTERNRRAQAIYLEACRKRALRVLGA